MRIALAPLIALIAASCPAEDALRHPAPVDGKPHGDFAVNPTCVFDGKPIDRRLQSICARLDERVVWIGACSDDCWEKVAKEPDSHARAALDAKKAFDEAAAKAAARLPPPTAGDDGSPGR